MIWRLPLQSRSRRRSMRLIRLYWCRASTFRYAYRLLKTVSNGRMRWYGTWPWSITLGDLRVLQYLGRATCWSSRFLRSTIRSSMARFTWGSGIRWEGRRSLMRILLQGLRSTRWLGFPSRILSPRRSRNWCLIRYRYRGRNRCRCSCRYWRGYGRRYCCWRCCRH